MARPVIVVKGKRLFKEGNDLKRLKLLNSQATWTGVMVLTYEPVRKS
jgi:hypothetical protein